MISIVSINIIHHIPPDNICNFQNRGFWEIAGCKQTKLQTKVNRTVISVIYSYHFVYYHIFKKNFTSQKVNIWNVEDLKSFFTVRGAASNVESCWKDQLIEKVIYAHSLDLPIRPTNENRQSEINPCEFVRN